MEPNLLLGMNPPILLSHVVVVKEIVGMTIHLIFNELLVERKSMKRIENPKFYTTRLIYLPNEVYARLRRLAKQNDIRVGKLMRQIIVTWANEHQT